MIKISNASQPGSRPPSAPLLYTGTPGKIDYDVLAAAPGYDLLCEPEQQLCQSLSIFPLSYMAMKDTLLKEHSARGSLSQKQARQLLPMDAGKLSKLYDFMLNMGWLY